MKKYVVYLFSICLILLILFHILAKIWPDSLYLDLVSLMGLCSFLCIFALLPLRQLRYPIGLILLAMGMLLVHGEADLWSGLWTVLREMRNLIPLIIVIPMFGWILNQGVYIPALLDRSKKWMHRSSTVYGGLLLIMMAGTLFISLGAIFLMYTLASTLLFGQAREWNEREGYDHHARVCLERLVVPH